MGDTAKIGGSPSTTRGRNVTDISDTGRGHESENSKFTPRSIISGRSVTESEFGSIQQQNSSSALGNAPTSAISKSITDRVNSDSSVSFSDFGAFQGFSTDLISDNGQTSGTLTITNEVSDSEFGHFQKFSTDLIHNNRHVVPTSKSVSGGASIRSGITTSDFQDLDSLSATFSNDIALRGLRTESSSLAPEFASFQKHIVIDSTFISDGNISTSVHVDTVQSDSAISSGAQLSHRPSSEIETSPSSSASTSSTDESEESSEVDRGPRKIDIFCKRISGFFNSPPEQHKMLKTLLSFPVGLILAFGLYKAIIARLPWPSGTHELAGVAIGFSFAAGYAVSVQIRCMSWLVLPTLLGKSGRSFIGTFALTYLILGPVNNIILNGKEITRSLSCSAELSANHSKVKFQLKVQPLRDMLLDIKKEGFMLEEMSQKIKKRFEPIRKEIEDQEEVTELQNRMSDVDEQQGVKSRSDLLVERHDAKSGTKSRKDFVRSRAKFCRKLDFRCEDVFSMGVLNCKKVLLKAYYNCLDALPYALEWLCYPVKIDYLCKLLSLLPGMIGLSCKSSSAVDKGVGKSYSVSNKMMDQLDSTSEVDLVYRLEHTSSNVVDATTGQEVKAKTMKEFDDKKKAVDFLLKLITHLLTFTFIFVIWSAHSYHKKYVLDIRHDNHYVTPYFERIEERRKQQNKRILLPPKSVEHKFLVFPKKLGMVKAEIKKLTSGTFKVLLNMATAAIIVLFDRLLYWVLDIIAKNSRISYKQTGEHHIKMEVYGTGFMSDIIRLFLRNFDKEYKVNEISTNYECLPRPNKLSVDDIWPVFVIYFITWICIIFEAYFLRLRRVIAGFFYRKREKKRVLYLYNEMLRKRKGFLRRMRHKVRKQLRRKKLENDATVWVSVRSILERCGILEKQLKCLICDENVEPDAYRICDTPGCGYGYCRECWIDCKELCYVCLPKEEHEKLSTLTSEEFGS